MQGQCTNNSKSALEIARHYEGAPIEMALAIDDTARTINNLRAAASNSEAAWLLVRRKDIAVLLVVIWKAQQVDIAVGINGHT